jgi:uncharacterized membrane protein YbaN (DUF454 family)
MEQESVSFLSRIKKGAYFIVGISALILGAIGAFLPVLPTTPFVLLSAWCFIRSSDQFYDWLISNERFGKTIKDYHSGLGITKNIKIRAVLMMWTTITISVYFFITNLHLTAFMYLTAVSVTFYIYRQPTLKEYIPEAKIGE